MTREKRSISNWNAHIWYSAIVIEHSKDIIWVEQLDQ